jgi:hypothetical protein
MRYKTKAEWAAAKAAEFEREAAQAAREPFRGPYSGRRYGRHGRAGDGALAEAARFRRLAARYAAQGL